MIMLSLQCLKALLARRVALDILLIGASIFPWIIHYG